MLKQLRFKNWRSLRDVTIDLSPLTVFIGANSSGKTNIIDGIKFMRDANVVSLVSMVSDLGYQAIQSYNPLDDGIVEFDFEFEKSEFLSNEVQNILRLKFDGRNFPFKYSSGLVVDGEIVNNPDIFEELPKRDSVVTTAFSAGDEVWKLWRETTKRLGQLYQNRMQFIDEYFFPTTQSYGSGDTYMIESDGSNTVALLEFLQHAYPEEFEELNQDIQWLMGHVRKVDTVQNSENLDTELRVIEENQRAASTFSVGTLRSIGILTALHALNLPRDIVYPVSGYLSPTNEPYIHLPPSTPGLVVIEEPDTALNPGVLRKFVELLRGYVENPDSTRPRQIIMTTHNPTFLNYFQPDEVRVVERGEDGYTTVNRVPEFIKENWLNEHTLGDMWLTNLFGGTNF